MNKIPLLLSICFFLFSIANAQTYIKDKQEVYGTWTKAGSPYFVQGEAIVPEGRTLRIEPGVRVEFKTGTNTNIKEKNCDVGFLRVNGTLSAKGESDQKIKFTGQIPNEKWGLIFCSPKSKDHFFSHCIFENGQLIKNISTWAGLGTVTLDYSNAIFEFCYFSDNQIRGISLFKGSADVKYCIFNNNIGHIHYFRPPQSQRIVNSTFLNSWGKGSVKFHGTPATVSNSIFFGNSSNFYFSNEDEKVYMNYCFFEEVKEIKEIDFQNTISGKSPKFMNFENGDFRLSRDSPCIGAGENGTDIGAIPYNKPKPESFDFTTTQKSPDQTAPQITITSPRNNIRTQYSNITLYGKATDESRISQVLVNNSLADLQSNGEFSAKVKLPIIGSNRIIIKATDQYWNTATKTITVFREQQQIEYEKRIALVIGNSNYDHKSPLPNPDDDARDMEAKLEGMHFEVLKYENLTWREMRSVISDFGRRLTDYDVGLVYYSGHGCSSAGENFLIPSDAILNFEDNVPDECISQNYILNQMKGAGSDVNILIFDACRNNPFTKSWSKGEEENAWVPADKPSGTFIAYATSPEKKAYEAEKNGAYTSELLKHIDAPGLTIEQVFKRVRRDVERKFQNSRVKMKPWESTSLTGDFYFVKKP